MSNKKQTCVSITVFGDGRAEVDARRIAACWNACDGFDTETIEQHSYGEQVRLKVKFKDQCDRLLAALELAAESLERAEFFERAAEARAHIASALALAVSTTPQPAPAQDVAGLADLLGRVKLTDEEARHHHQCGATFWNDAVLACQVAIRDALAARDKQNGEA